MTGKIMDLKFRIWLYGIGVAIGGVAFVYGLATAEQLAAILGLLVAILGVTAGANAGYNGVNIPRHVETYDDGDVK